MFVLLCVLYYSHPVGMCPRIKFRYTDHHTTHKRGAGCTYGKSERCHGAALQEYHNNHNFVEKVGLKKRSKICVVVRRYKLKCESVCLDARDALGGRR